MAIMRGKEALPRPCLSWNQSPDDMNSVCRSAMGALGPRAMATSRPWQYERIGKCDLEASSSSSPPIPSKKGRKPATLQLLGLGSGCGSRAGFYRSRIARLNRLMKVPNALLGRVKEQCAAWKSSCGCANLRVSDLFAGNQLFLHVHPAPVRCHKKQHDLKPSLGFLAGFQEAGAACETHIRIR